MKLDVLCLLLWLPLEGGKNGPAQSFLVRSQEKFWLNCLDLLKFSLFLLLLLWFQFWPTFAHYATSSLIWCNVWMCMWSFNAKKPVVQKIVYNEKKIQIFVMIMPFISSREARKCIFHSWLRHSWNMHFSLHLIPKICISSIYEYCIHWQEPSIS